MQDTMLQDLTLQAYRCLTFRRRADIQITTNAENMTACNAEAWLALSAGVPAAEIPARISNRLRYEHRVTKSIRATFLEAGLDMVKAHDRQMEAEQFLAVATSVLQADELALLKARELQELSFDDLARQSLAAQGVPASDTEAQRRETARLRQQVTRLRKRCAAAVLAVYPNAAEDIACWN